MSHGRTFQRKRDSITDWQIAARLGVHLEAVQATARSIGAVAHKVTLRKPCERLPEERHYHREEAERIARHCRGNA